MIGILLAPMRCAAAPLAVLTFLALPSSALARPTGEAQECANCHYDTEGPQLALNFGSESIDPGQVVDLTIDIEATNDEALRTGLMLSTPDQGQFMLVDPDTTRFADGGTTSIVLHSQARDLDSAGRAQFQFQWVAPDEAGVSDFTLWSMTGNTNGDSSDDHHATIRVSVAHGCDAINYYPDEDGDGFGNTEQAVLSCDPVDGLIEQGGDCDDEDGAVNPTATEVCNFVDDDCDGERDNGLEPGLYYPDPDGDGYGNEEDLPEFTCNNVEGFTAEVGDCAPDDPAIHPGAEEVENGRDDDCDGEIDEVDPVTPDEGDPAPPSEDVGDGGAGAAADGEDAGGCRVAGGTHPPLGALWGLLVLVGLGRRRGRRRA